jgi:hypothetical protein
MNITATAQKISKSHQLTPENSAVKDALSLLHQPRMVKTSMRGEIPNDVIRLLKVVAGESSEILGIGLEHNTEPESVVNAAKLYLQLLFASAHSDDRRMLCLPSTAVANDIKEHKKWLMKWLHPDRNHDKWESALFLKVNDAFSRLQKIPSEATSAKATHDQHRQRTKTPKPEPSYKKIDRNKLLGRAAKPVLFVVVIAVAGYTALILL